MSTRLSSSDSPAPATRWALHGVDHENLAAVNAGRDCPSFGRQPRQASEKVAQSAVRRPSRVSSSLPDGPEVLLSCRCTHSSSIQGFTWVSNRAIRYPGARAAPGQGCGRGALWRMAAKTGLPAQPAGHCRPQPGSWLFWETRRGHIPHPDGVAVSRCRTLPPWCAHGASRAVPVGLRPDRPPRSRSSTATRNSWRTPAGR